ncbi:MAG: radical SAM protein [Candidatus Coatesbacteria bacterium]|nr:radical SAM protein [Candidatus Coatesbacteria bacterium]
MTSEQADVLFVTCSYSQEEASTRQIIKTYTPPLGMASLAAYLLGHGVSAAIVDALALELTPDAVLDRIAQIKPKVIGLTSITSLFGPNKRLAGQIRARFPEVLIVLGGHHASTFKDTLLSEAEEFDIVVYPEGEIPLLNLVEAFSAADWDKGTFLADAATLSKIPGIVYRDHSGKPVVTERPPLITDLDTLPFPARQLLPMERYIPLPHQHSRLPAIHVMGSRGCPYRCAYCNNTAVMGTKLRLRSPENIIQEINELRRDYGAREIFFWDDTITADKKWLNRLCDILINEKMDITWSAATRVDIVNPEMLKMMKRSGCWRLFYGVESGVQELLDLLNKRTTLDQVRNAITWTNEAGIETTASFMIALPGETPEMAKETIKFALSLKPTYADFHVTTPFPGTRIYEEAGKYGRLNMDFSRYDCYEPVFVPFGYKDEEEIRKMLSLGKRSFYFRPSYALKKLFQIRSLGDINRIYRGLVTLLAFLKRSKRFGREKH